MCRHPFPKLVGIFCNPGTTKEPRREGARPSKDKPPSPSFSPSEVYLRCPRKCRWRARHHRRRRDFTFTAAQVDCPVRRSPPWSDAGAPDCRGARATTTAAAVASSPRVRRMYMTQTLRELAREQRNRVGTNLFPVGLDLRKRTPPLP